MQDDNCVNLSPLTKIVSGGQTGVDRGALDAVLAAGFPCGGWCPQGRIAEDGPIAVRYPLIEMPHGSFLERTIQNVIDSDGTVVYYFGLLIGGSEQTLVHCIDKGKPYKLIDGDEIGTVRAAELTAAFVARHGIGVLNVAGPRESQSPQGYAYVREAIGQMLKMRQ